MKRSSKVTAVILSAVLAMSMIGCGSSAEDTASDAAATDAVTDEATDAAASDEATDAADEAVFDIAIASSSVEDAEEAANVE